MAGADSLFGYAVCSCRTRFMMVDNLSVREMVQHWRDGHDVKPTSPKAFQDIKLVAQRIAFADSIRDASDRIQWRRA